MDNIHPTDRGPYLPDEVAVMTQQTAHPLTASYVRQLRLGTKTNPTVGTLRALAEVFEVPITFFFDERDQMTLEADLHLAGAVNGAGLATSVWESAAAFSPTMKMALAGIIGLLQAAEEEHHAAGSRLGGAPAARALRAMEPGD